jgi:hypothetical protein
VKPCASPSAGFLFGIATLDAIETAAGKLSLVDMTRLILKAIDLGASAVFMALFTKAFFFHFYKDVKRLTVEPLALPPQKSTLKRQGDVTNIISDCAGGGRR